MATSFFSLNQLPIPKIDDPTMTLQETHTKWVWQLRIVRGLQSIEKQTPLGPYLTVHLNSLAFLCGLALAELDLRLGQTSSWQRMSDFGNLTEITKAFLAELEKAKVAWDEWLGSNSGLAGPVGASTETSKVRRDAALGYYGGFGASDPDVVDVENADPIITELGKQDSDASYWWRLGVVASIGFIAYMIRD